MTFRPSTFRPFSVPPPVARSGHVIVGHNEVSLFIEPHFFLALFKVCIYNNKKQTDLEMKQWDQMLDYVRNEAEIIQEAVRRVFCEE